MAMLLDWKALTILLIGVILVCLGFVGADDRSGRLRSWLPIIVGTGLIVYSVRFLLNSR
jgi:hypothetical protein